VNLCLIKSPLSAKDDYVHLRTACNLSSKALWTWATWQAAQFTVNSKLRTPLGKPQETFSAFEGCLWVVKLLKIFTRKFLSGAIKSLAREFDMDKKAEISVPKSSIHDMKQARLLIDFLNHLEKCIYNASEGCAIAMCPPSKVNFSSQILTFYFMNKLQPARLFFYTNKTVCAEWMSRIRWAVVMVAIHSGMPHVAVRHGFELLYDLMSHQHIPVRTQIALFYWIELKFCFCSK
jgi:serine/threonine-protein kinase SMG1